MSLQGKLQHSSNPHLKLLGTNTTEIYSKWNGENKRCISTMVVQKVIFDSLSLRCEQNLLKEEFLQEHFIFEANEIWVMLLVL